MSEKNSVVAIFKSHDQAEDAVRELQKDGFDMKKLSIVGKDYHTDEHVVGYYNTGDRMMYWGKLGAFWGGFWGLLFGSAFFWVPGVGPVLVAGPLVMWIVGALEGAAAVGGAQRPRRRTVQHRHSEEQRHEIRDRGEERQASPGCPRDGRRGGTGQGSPASDCSGDDDPCRTGRRRRVTFPNMKGCNTCEVFWGEKGVRNHCCGLSCADGRPAQGQGAWSFARPNPRFRTAARG